MTLVENTHFFQTPKETCYGTLIHKNHASIFNPKIHYCECGGKAFSTRQGDSSYVSCQVCDNTSATKGTAIEAIYEWNSSHLSQFPSRIALLPFHVNKVESFDVRALKEKANKYVSSLNTPGNNHTNNIRLLASKYVAAWCDWFMEDYELVEQEEYEDSFIVFLNNFYKNTYENLSNEESRLFNNYCHIHSGRTTAQNLLNFCKVHMKSLYIKTLKAIPYPNRLKEKMEPTT